MAEQEKTQAEIIAELNKGAVRCPACGSLNVVEVEPYTDATGQLIRYRCDTCALYF